MLSRLGGPAARALAGLTAACVGVLALAASPASAGGIQQSQQWILGMLGAQSAWTASQGQGVTVAVLDSGVQPGVSDLAGSVVPGPDLTGVTTNQGDQDWGQHGTWMASIIAGHGQGGSVMGVAPKARILSVRVMPDAGDPGHARYEDEPQSRIQQSLAAGIRYAAAHGAQVISMSIGYGVASAAVRSALEYASARGAVVVSSSGNFGRSGFTRHHGYAQISFPADYPGVIGVAAVGKDGTAAGFSSGNLSVEVAAPGVSVPAQGRDDQYWLVSGTSPACALVAGVAALIKSRYPHLAPWLVARALTSTARNTSAAGYRDSVGFGTVKAPAALAAAGRLAASHHSPDAGVPAASTFGGGPASVPPAPVGPRGSASLIGFSVAALASLALLLAAVSRLLTMRSRTLARGVAAGETAVAVPSVSAQGAGLPGTGVPWPPGSE